MKTIPRKMKAMKTKQPALPRYVLGIDRLGDLPPGGAPRDERGRALTRDPRDPMQWRAVQVGRGGERQSWTSRRCGRRLALLHASYLLCRAHAGVDGMVGVFGHRDGTRERVRLEVAR